MIPITEYAGRDVAVYGLGRTGLSAAKALAAGGARVHAWDDGEAARAKAEAEGVNVSDINKRCLLYTSPSPRDGATSRMPSSA